MCFDFCRVLCSLQLRLKQSCEQKKLSLIPNFRHVGHCRVPASLGQSTPIHFLFAGGTTVISATSTSCEFCRFVDGSQSGLRKRRKVGTVTYASQARLELDYKIIEISNSRMANVSAAMYVW